MFPARPSHVQSVTGSKVESGWKVREIARPVCPGSDKARELAEVAFAPDVEPAFLRIPRCQFGDRKKKRKEETTPGANPDDDRTRASTRGGGNPAQADPSHDIK